MKKKWTHGGSQTKGNARVARPFAKNKWIQICFKSTQAKGRLSFRHPQNRILIEKLLIKLQFKYGVQIHDFANVGNHLHCKARTTHRLAFQNFLRHFTTLLARQITGARKGKPFGQFWDGLTFSRVLRSSREILYLKGYFQANRLEASKGYDTRQKFLSEFHGQVKDLLRSARLVKVNLEHSTNLGK